MLLYRFDITCPWRSASSAAELVVPPRATVPSMPRPKRFPHIVGRLPEKRQILIRGPRVLVPPQNLSVRRGR